MKPEVRFHGWKLLSPVHGWKLLSPVKVGEHRRLRVVFDYELDCEPSTQLLGALDNLVGQMLTPASVLCVLEDTISGVAQVSPAECS